MILYIPKIDNNLKILIDGEVRNFVVINFVKYCKFTNKKLCSKLNQEGNLGKFVKSIYIFLKALDEVEKCVEMMQSSSSDNCVDHYNYDILNLFDPELQLSNTK